ncbi:MAG: hypothetical protein M1826_001434 [Phylliscum demangeonii]|nr:MAG: hypothetical protein M1826_001434 [Phylliscum demangeonii]
MPFFRDLRDLRRRSRISLVLPHDSPDDGVNNGQPPPSSASSLYGSSTPPLVLQHQSSSANISVTSAPPSIPPRPGPSAAGHRGQNGSPNAATKPAPPTSPYAPRLLSVTENSWVHQKILLVYGQIGDPSQQAMDGVVTVNHHQDAFPCTAWPVCDSHFKALVHLTPGTNRLRLDFTSPKLAAYNGSSTAHSSGTTVNYLPLVSSPPLQLAILLAADSPMTFDAVPDRVQREGNGLDTALRKFRMAAYLWQAFTGEQMYRNRFGRRCFRFEEEWQTGTLTLRDRETDGMRNEAKIHVIRTPKTVAELRDLDLAQQYANASRKGDLFTIAMDAVREHFKPAPDQKQYVSVLMLDTHWDRATGVVRGHAALGGGGGQVQLAIFGSHALQSYPSALEEVVPAFSDGTPTDTDHVANDCNESGSNWEAANIGIGAHLHETGHLFGCPHQEHGVMLRDFVHFNRTFTCREPAPTRTQSPGLRLCLPKDECGWHRLDCLRFRHHPCFRFPQDPPAMADESVQVWAVGNGNVVATAAVGIAWIELFAEEELCRAHVEFIESGSPPKQVLLSEAELRSRLPDDRRGKRLRVDIHSAGQGSHTVDDFSQFVAKSSSLKLPNGQLAFKGSRLGLSQMTGSQTQDLILESAISPTKLLIQIKVFHGFAVDGLEFVYEDFTSQLFGQRGGQPGGSEFSLDTRRGETIMGFHLRAGFWIDGIEILTSLGRRSGIFGNARGGSGRFWFVRSMDGRLFTHHHPVTAYWDVDGVSGRKVDDGLSFWRAALSPRLCSAWGGAQ